MRGQFHMGTFQVGFVASAILIGNFVGAVVFGRISDWVGRRMMFIIDVVFFIVFALISAITRNYIELGVVRFLLGVGIGGDYALASPIIAEAMPSKSRGRLLTLNWGLAWLSGELVSFAVGFVLLNTTGADAWRWMLASGAIPAVVVLVARRSMTESPRWLASQGRHAEAYAAIDKLRDQTSQAGRPDETGQPLPRDAAAAVTVGAPVVAAAKQHGGQGAYSARTAGHRPWHELFGPYKRNTTYGLLNYVFEGAPFYALSVFLPTILKSVGYSKTDSGDALGNLLMQLAGLLGIALIFLMVDRQGRKFVNYLGYAGVCAALVTYVLVYPPAVPLLLALFALVQLAVWLGPASTDNLLLGELWPTRIRGTGAGICAGAGRLSAVAGTLLLPVMIGHWGVQMAMVPLIVMSFLGIVNTAVFGIETKGKSLEQLWGGGPAAAGHLASSPDVLAVEASAPVQTT